jgi:hypothetical protein
MRTTLTLDDDVAAAIERLQRKRKATLKDVVNDALRRGLRDIESTPKHRKPFRTRGIDVGKPYFDNVDNIAEVLAAIEGEDFK